MQRVCLKAEEKKVFPQLQVTKPIDSPASAQSKPLLILCETCLPPACSRAAAGTRAAHLLDDILRRAKAWSFDDGAWLLWGDIVYLNEEAVILRADGNIFLCFLKDVSLI